MQPALPKNSIRVLKLLPFLKALIGKDIKAWVDLFAEDAVVEFPYASALSLPERLEGKPATHNYIGL